LSARNLEVRDLEILRALLRVRYLTTRQLNRTFFSCPRVGRRRVHRLSDLNLIRPHTKGLPPQLHYTAWRVTSRAVDEIARAFPEEPIPDGLVERVTNGSLHHALHREALADLYLGLVVPSRAALPEKDLRAHRRWAAELRGRAGSITWEPDGDVVLTSSWLGQRTDVVPDAVVRSMARKRRVFVELDRSTKDLGRIRDCLERYTRVLADCDLGGDAVSVLFVVRSAARRANIEALATQVPGLELVVLREPEAIEWLREEALSAIAEPTKPRDDSVHVAARRAYVWITQLDGVLRQNGMHETLSSQDPALMNIGQERLLALYRALKTLEKNEGARP
jgi:hypothetical protein